MYHLIAGSAKRAAKQLCVSWLFVNEIAKSISTKRNEIDKPTTRRLRSVVLHHSGLEAVSESKMAERQMSSGRRVLNPKFPRSQVRSTQSEVV